MARKRAKKLKKHKAFGIVRREIAKKIREHERRKKSEKQRAKRKELDLAISELRSLKTAMGRAYTLANCPA